MSDILYCSNIDCPFKKCEHHLSPLKKIKDKSQRVRVANLSGVCRDYINYLLYEIERGKDILK